MKPGSIPSGRIIRHNYKEIIFVFAAFAVMALSADLLIGHILRSRLYEKAEQTILTTEANVRAGFFEAESILFNSYYTVLEMIQQNLSRQEIMDYLTAATERQRQRTHGLLNYYGIYGYIQGEFYDGLGMNPGINYVPQTRSWYQAAMECGLFVGYTTPYKDWHTGDTVVSAVKNIFIDNEDSTSTWIGVLSLDFSINQLIEYISQATNSGGYSILISQDMNLMAHPNINYVGLQLKDLGDSYAEISSILTRGDEVFSRQIIDKDSGTVIAFFTSLFNGWYMGTITPHFKFYRDLYMSAAILFILGTALAFSLCYILLTLSRAKMCADEENRSKSTFLANMSHEIRTPMNVITGMAELLLRRNLPNDARNDVQNIRQAGANLISIINDILDFSKIEAGKLEIVPAKYLFSSLINDTVNIIRMRLGEKPIRFFSNIDSSIPDALYGDEVRMRQILLNLLTNAIKYTEKGYIGLFITEEKRELVPNSKDILDFKKQVWLKFDIIDTGKGIKPEDQDKLFREFAQVDTKRNRGIEGTGLGLAITKRLSIVMGGDITVESEYGKGSIFTVLIPQGIASEASFASVEEPEKKKVLVYEGRDVYAKSVSWSLDNMNVPHAVVNNQDDFVEALRREEWFYLFSGYGLYDKIKTLIDQDKTLFTDKKQPPLALMVEWGIEAYIPNVRFLSLPVQSLSIANILNSKSDNKEYIENMDIGRFVFPGAKLLIVDDIATNLKVVTGLLKPYKVEVDTCLSGIEAVEMIKHHEYDLVFMDHMMPEMDGIEAAAAIRTWEKNQTHNEAPHDWLPIIALTANAVVGMREVFIEQGFNDFLAKPIDISKLDEILDRWIPKKKRISDIRRKPEDIKEKPDTQEEQNSFLVSHSPFFTIPDVDVQSGIAMTGGTIANYRLVLSVFCKDIEERLSLLKTELNGNNLHSLITEFHAIKSASASIGAEEVAKKAAELEEACNNEDLAFNKEEVVKFTDMLLKLKQNISKEIMTDDDTNTTASDGQRSAAAAVAADAETETETLNLSKKLIILVDDNPANLQVGKNVLSKKYTVATALSAKKLFFLLENNNPSLILLDINMPEMNGYETIKILKANEKTMGIPVIFLTGASAPDNELEGLSLGAIDYITKPFNPPLLLKRIEVHLLVEKQKTELKYFNDNLQKMVENKTKNVINLQNALLKTMAEMVDCRDDITGGHIERTQQGVRILLDEIKRENLYQEESKGWDTELLIQSCQLHDVGKISIGDNILKKPGKLNNEEIEEMKKHAVYGEKALEKIESLTEESEFLKYAKIFAACHHEKWDGTGYPRGLKGNEIPLLGRIMAVADIYDALISVRPYKPALSHDEAVRIINEGRGTQFDPLLVDIFNQTAEKFKNIS